MSYRAKLIYLDAPWRFEAYDGRDDIGERHYNTMPIADLHRLGKQVRDVADTNCHVLMWGTDVHAYQMFVMAENWGLTYKTKFLCWAKPTKEHAGAWFSQPMSPKVWVMGRGMTTRSNPEDLWMFTWGKPVLKADRPKDISRLLVHPLGAHSQKPAVVYGYIEQMFNGPYLELFARQYREGWTSLGDDLSGNDIQHDLLALKEGGPEAIPMRKAIFDAPSTG